MSGKSRISIEGKAAEIKSHRFLEIDRIADVWDLEVKDQLVAVISKKV